MVDHSEPHLLDVRGSEVGDTDTVDLVLLPEIGVIAERVSAPGVFDLGSWLLFESD